MDREINYKMIRKIYEYYKIWVTKLKNKIVFFNEYSTLKVFGNVISISGTPLFKRLFWTITLTCCCYGAAAVLKESLSLYQQDAVSYTVETDYLHWDSTFPAVTLCESANDNILKQRLKNYNVPVPMLKTYKQLLYWNYSFCKLCLSCKLNVTCSNDFLEVIQLIRARCEDVLQECWWNGEPFPCCDRFLPIETEYGLCYAFNSRVAGETDIKTVNRKNSLPILEFTTENYLAMRVHSPYDMTSSTAENILGHCSTLLLGTELKVDVKVEETVTDVSVRSISQSSRDCLFDEESPEFIEKWPFSFYTFNGCAWYCRALAQVQYCNCTYQFMPRIPSFPVCDIQGLKCLFKNFEMLENVRCPCPLPCRGVEYKATYTSCVRGDEKVSRVAVRLSQFPSLRVRRQAIRDMLGLVVDFGGVIGVFFGASLLSFLEIIYIFCLR